MRTDSVNIARMRRLPHDFIVEKYGETYYPEKPNYYKSRASAQEAHEAIRPTDVTSHAGETKGILDGPNCASKS